MDMAELDASFLCKPLFQRFSSGTANFLLVGQRSLVGLLFSKTKVSLAPKLSRRRREGHFLELHRPSESSLELPTSPSLEYSVGTKDAFFFLGAKTLPKILLAALGAGLSTIPFRFDSRNTACNSKGIRGLVFIAEGGG